MTGLPLNVDWQQILLHLFNFTILFGLLYILLYNPVKKFMTNREQQYEEMDRKANEELAAAEKSRQEYDTKLKDFKDEIKSEKSKMRQEVEEERNAQLAKAKADADKIVSDAREEANREKADILSSAQKDITNLLTDAMEKLTPEETASAAFDQFLDAAETENKASKESAKKETKAAAKKTTKKTAKK